MAQIDLGLVTGPVGPAGERGPEGPQGYAGKSAYEFAKDGGYTGGEGEFNADLANIPDLLGGLPGQVLVSNGVSAEWKTISSGKKYGNGPGQISTYELAMHKFNPYYTKGGK